MANAVELKLPQAAIDAGIDALMERELGDATCAEAVIGIFCATISAVLSEQQITNLAQQMNAINADTDDRLNKMLDNA